jgi:splicing factor 3B subunit 2
LQKAETPAPAVSDAESKTDDVANNGAAEAEKAEPVREPEIMDIDDFGEAAELDENSSLYQEFKHVFAKFQEPTASENGALTIIDKPKVFYDEDDDIPSEDEEKVKKAGKKAKKLARTMTVAQLKSSVEKPELVEWTDPSSSDPLLLLAIRANRNVVPVPGHWSLKREYLSSKRGIEKPPFALPKYIASTGISATRDATLEREANMSLKQKQRERVQGKMGKLDIDYQKLHDAFFKFQCKPPLTRYGEVYYEGKEWETNLKHLRPGVMSEELKNSLNIPPGAPPPWLINQQRYGPPPSYPGLRIPGLNAPIPPGAQWGFHPGGYGKPPVDEHNRPIYGGDLLGTQAKEQEIFKEEKIDKSMWGELEAQEEPPEEESEEEESEYDEEEDEEAETVESSAASPAAISRGGSEQPVERTIETFGEEAAPPRRRSSEAAEDSGPKSLYTVVSEQKGKIEGFMGGSKRYDIKSAEEQARARAPVLGEERGTKRKAGDVDVSVDVDALERGDKLSKNQARQLYEESTETQNAKNPWKHMDEDLDDLIEEESRKRLKKDKEDRDRRRERQRR